MEDSHLKPIISFLVIMSIVENSHLRPFVFFWPTRSNTQKTSSFSEEIMNAPQSTASMDFMTNVSEDTFLV